MNPELRELGPDDNDRLLAVCRACPIEASFRVLFDRGDDFFAWARHAFERHRYVGAFMGEELVGYMMIGWQTGWVGDGQEPFAYIGDARVLPAWRRRRVVTTLIDALLSPPPDEVRAGFFLIAQGNTAAAANVALQPRARPAATFSVRNLPLFAAKRWEGPPGFAVRSAEIGDFGALAELFNRAQAGRPLAPHLEGASLAARLARFGLSASDVTVVTRGSAPVAFGAAWDQAPHHVTRVLGYSASGRLQKLGWDLAATWYRAARLPAAGGVLRALSLTTWAASDAASLRALVASIGRARARTGHHLLHVGFTDGDPLEGALAGFRSQRFPSTIVYGEREGFRIPEGLPWVDVATI